mmetsp:Transcript_12115/g.28350  ORF Transcript_12115/g.28350 Transcript_12115/m.28350 type:complete len:92 (+) Transcript_12115:2285-2560(+)
MEKIGYRNANDLQFEKKDATYARSTCILFECNRKVLVDSAGRFEQSDVVGTSSDFNVLWLLSLVLYTILFLADLFCRRNRREACPIDYRIR